MNAINEVNVEQIELALLNDSGREIPFCQSSFPLACEWRGERINWRAKTECRQNKM